MTMKAAIICKKANRYTSLGKCYLVNLKTDSNGHRSVSFTLDNGVTDLVNDHGQHCAGGFNGNARFSPINVSKECYLGQPALTRMEAQAISILACLDVAKIENDIAVKIKDALDNGKDLSFSNGFFDTVQYALRNNGQEDEWLGRALLMASDFMSKDESYG